MKTTIKCFDSSSQIRLEDDVKNGKNEIKLLSLKNGHDFSRIVVSCSEKHSFSISVDDLKSKNDILNKENIKLYYGKFINIDRNWHKNGMPTGHYVDAIIPNNATIFYEENIVDKDKTAHFFVDVYIPSNQNGGIYNGEILIKFDNDVNFTIPLSVEVYDSCISDFITGKNLFPFNSSEIMLHYEGRNDNEILSAYNKVFKDNLVSSSCITNVVENDIESWSNEVFNYLKDGKLSFNLPEITINIDGQNYIDVNDLKNRIVNLSLISLKNKLNIIPKLFYYDWVIDEPFLANIPDGKVKKQIDLFNEAIENSIKELLGNNKFNCKLGKQIIESVKNIPHLITDFATRICPEHKELKNSDGSNFYYDVSKVCLCPQFDGYDIPYRHLYDAQSEKWWYGCNSPNAPFPGYHIDDAGYSARIIGYLMAEYDITGNLYWLTNYGYEINTTGSSLFLDDPFEIAHRGLGSNGEGVLVYPGKNYGILGPIETIRLKRIRQSIEEYEIIKDLIKKYKEKGVDGVNLVNRILSVILDGTKLEYNFQHFEDLRRSFLTLYETLNLYGLVVDIKEEKNSINYKFSANENFYLKVNDKKCDKEFVLNRNNTIDKIQICFENGNDYVLNIYSGNGVKIILHETLFNQKAFSGDIDEININYHAIYREVKIKPNKGNYTININTNTKLQDYSEIGFLVNARNRCEYEIIYENQMIQKGNLVMGWNRIDLQRSISGQVISIKILGNSEIGFGEIYLK